MYCRDRPDGRRATDAARSERDWLSLPGREASAFRDRALRPRRRGRRLVAGWHNDTNVAGRRRSGDDGHARIAVAMSGRLHLASSSAVRLAAGHWLHHLTTASHGAAPRRSQSRRGRRRGAAGGQNPSCHIRSPSVQPDPTRRPPGGDAAGGTRACAGDETRRRRQWRREPCSRRVETAYLVLRAGRRMPGFAPRSAER